MLLDIIFSPFFIWCSPSLFGVYEKKNVWWRFLSSENWTNQATKSADRHAKSLNFHQKCWLVCNWWSVNGFRSAILHCWSFAIVKPRHKKCVSHSMRFSVRCDCIGQYGWHCLWVLYHWFLRRINIHEHLLMAVESIQTCSLIRFIEIHSTYIINNDVCHGDRTCFDRHQGETCEIWHGKSSEYISHTHQPYTPKSNPSNQMNKTKTGRFTNKIGDLPWIQSDSLNMSWSNFYL